VHEPSVFRAAFMSYRVVFLSPRIKSVTSVNDNRNSLHSWLSVVRLKKESSTLCTTGNWFPESLSC